MARTHEIQDTPANLRDLEAAGIEGYIADTQFRKRDPHFATAERHKPAQEEGPRAAVSAEGLRPRSGDQIMPMSGR
jgi:hypothetical protein